MKTRPFILVVLITWLVLAGAVLAASSTNYDLPFSVSSSGGGERASTSYQLTDTLGQTAINACQSDNFLLHSGFLGPGSPTVFDATPPSAVTDLTVSVVSANSVVLEWTAPGDDGDSGTANQYDIRYSTSPITESNWDSATPVVPPVPSPAGTTEHCRVAGLSATHLYYLALKTADEVPNWSGLSNVATCTTLPGTDINYDLPFSIISSGGGERASTSYQLTDTLGQTAINACQSDNFLLRSGFLGPGSLIVLDAIPPSSVTDLTVGVVSANSMVLEWTAPGDNGDAGTANQYNIRYSTSPVTESNWSSATPVVPPTPSPAGTTEYCRVAGLSATTMHYFALKTADEIPNWSGLSNVAECTTLAGTDLCGDITLTTGSGNGTFQWADDEIEITSGYIEFSGDVSGDLSGTFSFEAFYNPSDGQWYATSVLQDVTLLGHPAVYLGTGEAFNYQFQFSPLGVTFDLWADVWAWTTDGSNISADIAACGSGGGHVSVDLDEYIWNLTDPEAIGSYPSEPPCPIGIAIARDLAGAAVHGDVTIPGSGTVVLDGVAELYYTTTGTGTIILAQYANNPGGTTPKLPLDTFIEIDSDIIAPEITWPIELRIYYTDEELEAAGIDESTLTMYKWDGSNWVEVAESGVNTEENYVWANLYSFSIYGPMGDPLSPPPPSPAVPMVSTLSQWGLVAMIAAFTGLLVWTMWRRRPVRS